MRDMKSVPLLQAKQAWQLPTKSHSNKEVRSIVGDSIQRFSGSVPFCYGGIPHWSSINLQVDNHFLKCCAIGLADLVLHERLRTLIPYFVVQDALWISHVLDQRSLNERLLLHNVCEDILQLRGELPLRGLFHTKVNNEGDLI